MNNNDKNSFENYEKRISEEFENSTIFNSEQTSVNKKTKSNNKHSSYVKLLCALLCLLIVISTGIFSVVNFWPEEEVVSTTVSTDATIALTQSANVSLENMKNAPKDAISNVSKIVIKNETDKFVCIPYKSVTTDSEGNKTENVSFKLQGIDTEIPIDSLAVTSFYDSLFEVYAISKLDDKWNEKDCGLDKAKITVDVTMADKSSFNIKVGDKVATSDGYYYVSTSLKDGIYIAEGSVYDAFSLKFNDLVNLTLYDAVVENNDNSEYFNNGQLAFFDSIELDGNNFNSAKLSYRQSESEVMLYYIEEPVKTYADDEKITTLLSPLSGGLSASYVYKVKPDNSDLQKYGLLNPYLEVNYVLGNKVYNIKLSKPGLIDNNYSACIINDRPVIYALLCDNLSFINWSLDDLRFNLLYLKNIEAFKTFTAKYKGNEYKYILSFDASDEGEDKILSVVHNSSPIEETYFKRAYQRLTMASAAKYLGKDVDLSASPALSFEIELENGKVDIIEYIKYNENYYLHKLNGIGDELIPARVVESLIANYENLRLGKAVASPNNQQ